MTESVSNENKKEYEGKSFPLEPPTVLQREAYYKGEENEPTEELKNLNKERLGLIFEILNHPAMDRLIEEGNITFGAIKPSAHESKLGLVDDVAAERELLRQIVNRRDTSLRVAFSVSLRPSREELEEFYEDAKAKLQSISEGDSTAWDNMIESMMAGPVTYFLLCDSEFKGDAVREWRRIIGATNPSEADEESIRGKFALGMPNNLVHGASYGDSREEAVVNVKHEVGWLRNRLIEKRDLI